MPLFRQYEIGGAKVSVWKITETLEELHALVPKECADFCRGESFHEKRSLEWLAVRAMLAQLFGDTVRVVYDCSGKPMLEGVGLFISISHTDGYAAVACSRDFEVGLDVELISRNVLAVATRFMQRDILEGLPPMDANRVALCHWCAKEALFKITGDLGGNFKDNILVGCHEACDRGIFPVEVVGVGCCGTFVADCRCMDGLCLVVCRQ